MDTATYELLKETRANVFKFEDIIRALEDRIVELQAELKDADAALDIERERVDKERLLTAEQRKRLAKYAPLKC